MMVLILVLGPVFAPAEAGTKKCLGEMFTNTSCGPCKNANLQLDKWTDPNNPAYIPDWIVIRYHTWWPSSSDPFYSANTSQNKARTNYYGVNYVPDMWLGNDHGTSSYGLWKGKAQQQIGEYTPYNVTLYGSFDPATLEVTVEAHVWTDGGIANTDHRIFFVLTQDEVAWNAPNGQKIFFQAMMRMVNGTAGASIIMGEGDYTVYKVNYTLDPNWPNKYGIQYDWHKTNMTVFIQRQANKKIKAAETVKLKDLEPAPTLWADRVFLSAATGDDIAFHLQAGSDYGGRKHLLLGGVSGTVPGTPLPGGKTLPLNWDLFTGVVISQLNTPFFADFFGTLDGNGEAEAHFNTFGPLDPGLVGMTFSFAYTLMGPFDMVSNPVDLPVDP